MRCSGKRGARAGVVVDVRLMGFWKEEPGWEGVWYYELVIENKNMRGLTGRDCKRAWYDSWEWEG